MKKTLPYSLLALKLSCPHQDEKFNSFTKDGKGGGRSNFSRLRVLMPQVFRQWLTAAMRGL